MNINLHFNQFNFLDPKFWLWALKETVYLFSWQLYWKTVSYLVSMTKEDQRNLLYYPIFFFTILFFFIDLQLQLLVFIVWINWWTPVLEVWTTELRETPLGSFLLEETWEKIPTAKASAWTDMYPWQIWKNWPQYKYSCMFFLPAVWRLQRETRQESC